MVYGLWFMVYRLRLCVMAYDLWVWAINKETLSGAEFRAETCPQGQVHPNAQEYSTRLAPAKPPNRNSI